MDVTKLLAAAAVTLVLTQCGAASAPSTAETAVDGKAIFTTLCAQCHGADGKKGVGGAKDLSVTALSTAEIETIIRNGKGAMPAYAKSLNETEISAVAAYVHTLKQ